MVESRSTIQNSKKYIFLLNFSSTTIDSSKDKSARTTEENSDKRVHPPSCIMFAGLFAGTKVEPLAWA